MPVTLSPPPFPTPDHSKVSASSASSDAAPESADAFASLLQAAGSAKADTPAAPAEPSAQGGAVQATEAAQASPAATPVRRPARPHTGGDPLRDLFADARRNQSGLVAGSLASVLPAGAGVPPGELSTEASKPLHRGVADDDGDTMLGDTMTAMTAALTAVLNAAAGQAPAPDRQQTALGVGGKEGNVVGAGSGNVASRSAMRNEQPLSTVQEDFATQARPVDRPTDSSPQPLSFAASTALMQEARPTEGAMLKSVEQPAEVTAPVMPATPQTPVAPAPVISVDTPVGAPGWQSEFAGKLSQVVVMRSDSAEFHLHPAELGPIDVQISFAADQAVILITAPHAASRDALEQALPYLRDMLADQGIALGQASVQSESRQSPGETKAQPGATGRDLDGIALAVPEPRLVHVRGLVDTFA